ncbi:Two-component response regulator-like [Quillaja saponaria]|uniref:Two-component response regulator-like n=1 Tax=Quillaja saponaria TaxID=32244 RepID=A0AAD7LY71_QUISA|nr:Two-component response regulator-like [Quillaja saponaria]
MSEVVLSSEELELQEIEMEKEKADVGSETQMKGGGSSGVVRWEKFLPRMTMRVLLVEADDSTRQIISSLLRKCSYRVMSSEDSASTVYKCMLRNLWQHVWRRQSSTTGINGPQDESHAHQKIEATAENNASSNGSSGNRASIQRNKELIEKGSGAQVGYMKFDVKTACLLPLAELLSEGRQTHVHLSETLIMHESHVGGKFDSSPQLDLSLRRSHPSSFEKEVSEERPIIMYSNASAFQREEPQIGMLGGLRTNILCHQSKNVDQVAAARVAAESKNEDFTNNGNSHRSVLREAVLSKFRLKWKEICYEKKVQYESRKKLAAVS